MGCQLLPGEPGAAGERVTPEAASLSFGEGQGMGLQEDCGYICALGQRSSKSFTSGLSVGGYVAEVWWR